MGSIASGGKLETVLRRPAYAERFRCIGPVCEDSCCAGWTVAFDEAACRKYEAVPAGALRLLLDANVERQPAKADGSAPKMFAKVRLDADHTCPFLTREKLCRIQAEYGESYLSVTCATYPRIKHRIDGLDEAGLSLSCPEAARLVLGAEDLLGAGPELRMKWDGAAGVGRAVDLKAYFWPVREFVLRLLTNREYSLWQRLFLIGVFVKQLAELGRGEVAGGFGALLGGFSAAVAEGSFRVGMETIAPDLNLQLDLVLRLAGLRLPRSCVGARFVGTVENFKAGIGNEPRADMADLLRGYRRAYTKYYEPFFATHPQMLENLLINAVFKGLFPFGTSTGAEDWKPALEREFALLVAQFALFKGLLIGVAGFHRRKFGEGEVIQTVQSVSKHFEHHPAFLEEAYRLLVERGVDTPRGLTMLIRN